mmetsp:Transcript_82291/g.129590  ORF Transcript_82291/g.129590 Transcript_82291/m.129590 type:complete len:204 (+) Transcript_82291:255-866(+)
MLRKAHASIFKEEHVSKQEVRIFSAVLFEINVRGVKIHLRDTCDIRTFLLKRACLLIKDKNHIIEIVSPLFGKVVTHGAADISAVAIAISGSRETTEPICVGFILVTSKQRGANRSDDYSITRPTCAIFHSAKIEGLYQTTGFGFATGSQEFFSKIAHLLLVHCSTARKDWARRSQTDDAICHCHCVWGTRSLKWATTRFNKT